MLIVCVSICICVVVYCCQPGAAIVHVAVGWFCILGDLVDPCFSLMTLLPSLGFSTYGWMLGRLELPLLFGMFSRDNPTWRWGVSRRVLSYCFQEESNFFFASFRLQLSSFLDNREVEPIEERVTCTQCTISFPSLAWETGVGFYYTKWGRCLVSWH